MTQQLLFPLLIICYILSLVICLVSASLSKRIPGKLIKAAIFIHFFFLALSVFLFATDRYAMTRSLFFAGAFCLGMIIFGMISRRVFSLVLKIYFGIFILSFPVFIVSPSTILSVVSMGELKKNMESKISLGDGFFLEVQQAMIQSPAKSNSYKIIKRLGYFNKTIARDLYFSGHKIDSAKMLDFNEEKDILVRGYFTEAGASDSADVLSRMIRSSRDTLIQIKKK